MLWRFLTPFQGAECINAPTGGVARAQPPANFWRGSAMRNIWKTTSQKVCLSLVLFLLALHIRAAQFYVSPSGSATGNGSWNRPWDLQTALNQPAPIQPGDTLWLMGGVYRNANRPTKFVSQLSGASGRPITVRQYPGQRATVDGNIAQYSGGWANYWGFEIMDSQQFGPGITPTRVSPQSGPFPTTWYENYNGQTNDFTVSGFDLQAPNCKLINLVIHDNIGGGIGVNIAAGDSEIYGCLSYYNGWQGTDRGHGHGLYGQNASPNVKHVENCIFFDNFALGMQDTGTGPQPVADGFDVEGNVYFLNGALATSHQGNLLLGPNLGNAQNIIVISNYIYDIAASYSDFLIGNTDVSLVENNYFQTSSTFGSNLNLTLINNSFIGGVQQLNVSRYPNNNYSTNKPATNVIIVEPNKYEPGRANIIIFNWQNLAAVSVDVSHVLPINTPYQIVNAQNFFGAPVLSGVYSGALLNLPMSGLTVAQPVGTNKPSSSGPAFNVFVLLPVATSTVVDAGLPALLDGAAVWGDFDNDGNLDVLLTGEDSDYHFVAEVWRNLGNGTFTNINAGLPGVVESSIALADFDKDGYLDILLTGYNANGDYISQAWRNQGNGTFALINTSFPGVAEGAVAWGDFDNDGHPDLLLTGYNGTKAITQIWRNVGDGTFSNMNVSLPGVYHSAVALGDFDGDGKLDILLAGSSDSGVITQVWRNLGDGHFQNINTDLPGVVDGSVAWGDFDNDGHLDILLTGLLEDGVTPVSQVWRNSGNGTFTNVNAGLPGVYYSSAAWGDYDNDGALDILLAGFDGTNDISQVWRNLGGGAFTNIGVPMPGVEKNSASWGDYNNDGKLDALLIGSGAESPNSAVWQNNLPPANSIPDPPSGLKALVNGSGVVLSWQAATDCQTPSNGLSYNLRVGTFPGGADIVAPQANPASGRRYVPQWGNAQNCLQATLTNLAVGNYFWSVQTIDTAFAGSGFAREGWFSIGLPNITGGNLSNGIFELQLTSGSSPTFRLQSSTNLLQWVTLVRFFAGANRTTWFGDTNASNHPVQYYRVSQP